MTGSFVLVDVSCSIYRVIVSGENDDWWAFVHVIGLSRTSVLWSRYAFGSCYWKFKSNLHTLSSSVHILQPVEGLKGIINNLGLWEVFLQCG